MLPRFSALRANYLQEEEEERPRFWVAFGIRLPQERGPQFPDFFLPLNNWANPRNRKYVMGHFIVGGIFFLIRMEIKKNLRRGKTRFTET